MTPMIFQTHYFDTGYLADAYAWITWPFNVIRRSYNTFSENDLFTPVTPNDPGWIFRPITFVEGIQLINMQESRDRTI